MSRKKSPALYELYSTVPTATSSQPRRDLKVAAWAPIVLAAVVALLLVGAYLLGVARGERLGRADAQVEREELLSSVDRSSQGSAPEGSNPSGGAIVAAATNVPEPANGAGNADVSRGATRYPPVDPEIDPREVGKLYLTVCTVPTENAPKVANFLREQGLEAFVVPCNNARSREVIVLPGFSDRGDSGAIERLKDRVRTVGLIWKQTTRDTRGFSDCYAKPFSGRS
ncbi:MAG: hypothetical protein EXS10_04390 [Phycisphaerales bacterium]|nr:hypothetical protein [Phycisphaerales bacterium]